ncbi:hypothetical protein [Paenibacillus odorifer]|uniref:hypothetical protein n=1 Tax=Paenibacillus odorifer TaxID=189426 RepID=UPI00096C3010|nr:hypothetical protein [Paenibacillus odorifer]OMD67464.1 hypothetical protein BSK50_30270 [Paenibacillus odorifer]
MTRAFEFNSMNNIKNTGDFNIPNLKQTSPFVEIFSAITRGKDMSRFDGKKVDQVYARLKELGEQANNGFPNAKAEINTIVRYDLEPKLNEFIQLASFMGTYKNIGYDEQPMMRTHKHESIRSNFQASQGDPTFGTTEWREYPISTQTISSGFAVNYREIASGNLDKVAEGMKQVEIDMMNKSVYYIILKLYNAIKDAKGVKYFAENSGINKTALDDILKKVRRFGKPSIMGDFSVVSQLNDFAGFKADPTDAKNTFLSEAVMNEIRQTGLLSTYKGSPVVELMNSYNRNTLNDVGDNFKTYLPEGLLFVVPQGNVSPLQIFKRGGITTMTGNDVVTGTELTRFDMELGVGVAEGREYEIALLSDTNFELPEVK